MALRALFSLLFLFSLNTNASVMVDDLATNHVLTEVLNDGSEVQSELLNRSEEKTYLLIEFATTWCGYCQRNMPLLSDLSTQNSDNLDTKVVFIDRNPQDARDYIAQKKDQMNFQTLIDIERKTITDYVYSGYIPALFLIDNNNTVIWTHVGGLSESNLTELKSKIQK